MPNLRNSQLKKHLDKSADSFKEGSLLYQESANDLLARTQFFKIKPKKILDLGSGIGIFSKKLQDSFKDADIFALDISEKRLKYNSCVYKISDSFEVIPFEDHSVDLISAHLLFHWVLDLSKLLEEINRVLVPGGILIFTYFGPDTFKELGEAYPPFIDMHEVGDALKFLFSSSVLDREYCSIEYDSFLEAKEDLIRTGDDFLLKMDESDKEEEVSLTYEIIYGHAFSRVENEQNSKEFSVSLDSIQKNLSSK